MELLIAFAPLLVNLLMILIFIAVLYLIIYLFERFVTPIDNRIKGVVIFVVLAILIIYLIQGGSLAIWR